MPELTTSVGRLRVELLSDTEIRFSRPFDAPPALVWDCHTKPELVRRWMLGPPGWTMPVCEIDLRVGGRYRYVWRKTGTDMGMGGVYRDVAAPERLVATEKFDGDIMGPETLVTQLFVDDGAGGTSMTMHILYSSKAHRDHAFDTGMTGGMEQSYERVDLILADRI